MFLPIILGKYVRFKSDLFSSSSSSSSISSDPYFRAHKCKEINNLPLTIDEQLGRACSKHHAGQSSQDGPCLGLGLSMRFWSNFQTVALCMLGLQ